RTMREVVFVDGVRSATGKFGGSLSTFSAPTHGGECVKFLVQRTGIDPSEIDEVIIGTHFQAGIKANSARQCLIYAGLPDTIPAFTPNKNCATALKAMQLAAQSIQVGDNDVVIAGGTETMSAIPYLLDKARFGYRMGPGEILDSMLYDGLVDPFMNYHMGITAENVAEKCGITREMQDEFAVASHQKAAKAWAEGKYDQDIVPITLKSKKGDTIFNHDETYLADAKLEDFQKMKPVFKRDGGTVTVGNASPINDGSAVFLMMSADKAKELGYKPIAKYIAATSTALHPSIMGYAPVSAVEKLEKKTGISRDQVGLWELNEAFAAQAAACVQDLKLDPSIVNVNGGAIALGHAVGCTGARISLTLMREMQRRKVQYGVTSLCIGGGQAMAMLFELID
ncbi:MAG TPA: thiolase family protein, partial [Anaerovoracaceae bacterium]|nr:thiolase family protein [Anaerovoracaceae bacterium]